MFIRILPYLEQGAWESQYHYGLPPNEPNPFYRGWTKFIYDHGGSFTDPTAGDELMQSSLEIFRCPSNSRWAEYPMRRDYAGCVGGRNQAYITLPSGIRVPAVNNFQDPVYNDGVYVINSPRKLSMIEDGTSNTIAIGEFNHPHVNGAGPGHDNPEIGGYIPWYVGSKCQAPCNTIANWKYDRGLQSTVFPINAKDIPLSQNRRQSIPYGSDHPGGAQFVFVDGHVQFINDSIDIDTYQWLSTISALENETIDTSSF